MGDLLQQATSWLENPEHITTREHAIAALTKLLTEVDQRGRKDAFEEAAKCAQNMYDEVAWHTFYRVAGNNIAHAIRSLAKPEAK